MIKIEKTVETQDNNLKEYALQTLERIKNLGNEGIAAEWPTYTEERSRIAHNSRYFKNKSINELYQDVYKVNIESQIDNRDVQLGDIIKLNILHIDKNGVIFDQSNIKETIKCNVKLYQYPNLVQHIFDRPIDFKVIEKNNNSITVDPFASMLDIWMEQHVNHLEYQKDISGSNFVEIQDLQLTRGGYVGKININNISEVFGKESYMKAFVPGSQIVLNIENDFNKWVGKTVRAHVMSYSTNAKYGDMLIVSPKEYLTHIGNINIIYLFNQELEYQKLIKQDPSTSTENPVKNRIFDGKITGICNTSKKCGVFVEIPFLNITGMLECTPDTINTYKRGSEISVSILNFDKKNPLKKPYEIKDNTLINCNLRLLFREVKNEATEK